MGHLKSLGAFLSDGDEDEIHKRVGHFTLIEVRRGKKNWSELINGARQLQSIDCSNSLAICVTRTHCSPDPRGKRSNPTSKRLIR